MPAEARAPRTSRLPAYLAVAVVALQIAYPLTQGSARDRLSAAIVVVLAATWVLHALLTRGSATAAGLLLVTAVPGFGVEVLGVHTGFPFGHYRYDSSLGTRVWDVPWVIPLAWTMLAWPAALAARRLARGPAARVVVGAWALAAADLFLDPQMVDDHRWRFATTSPHLPGVADVPLTNYAGWLGVALVLSLVVQALLAVAPAGDERLPVVFYLWLYVGWVVALAVFLGLPAAAGWGALGMGAVAAPLGVQLWRSR